MAVAVEPSLCTGERGGLARRFESEMAKLFQLLRQERALMMAEHLQMLIDRHGERRGCVEFRTRISWWAKGLTPCPNLRRNGPRISSKAEFDALLEDLMKTLNEETTAEEDLEVEAAA